MKSTTGGWILSGHCQKHQNHSERKPGTAYTPKWMKMPTLASSYHCNIYAFVSFQNVIFFYRCNLLTSGRGRASRLFHVGSYLTQSDTEKEETKERRNIVRKAKEFSAPLSPIFQSHLINCLLWMMSGFVVCYVISLLQFRISNL